LDFLDDEGLTKVRSSENDFYCTRHMTAIILRPYAPSRTVSQAYYIAKGQKTLGPCTLDDLRNFLAYGSIAQGDLVMRDGEQQWRPVASLMEIAVADENAASLEKGGLSFLPRRRTVRYRDYERVPKDQRGSVMLGWIILGFLIFPPLLWRGAVSIYSHPIFSPKADGHGYLRVWPRWPEVTVTLMIVLNGILWWALWPWPPRWCAWRKAPRYSTPSQDRHERSQLPAVGNRTK
jgi:hypothetical protein